ncbi:hypothetical protein DY000_02022602 [Brassica cretica]|uniref:ATPase AAA-type core domain-containing protein n=1 Tax=Brassica cretica TaxID=69181 RepID=A0ABQ7EF09_BRACR|nr:hypothetical protein DY000_02022602 [Brassica cretica]
MIKGKETKKERAVGEEEDAEIPLPIIYFLMKRQVGGGGVQRVRSARPTTIHDCALSGDLISLQKLLKDNPSLLNERNPVMYHTPLHVSAGNGNVDIVKYLLDWPGSDKVELEAMNTYGETPLHMAAKNGCNEAAKLLLERGAFIEAKASNGMTPLHLAVWYSITSKDISTVKTLLDNNADCSAKDNEGMTPLDHLPQGQGSEKLRELLRWFLQEQRKRSALESCGKTKAKMELLEEELSNIVGLSELKTQLRKWAKGMLLDERRRALGMNIGTRRPPHMAFLGNPGTGKTMVARVLGKLLHTVGILPTDKADDKDYGLEALEEIMSVMDTGKIVVIFAGYSEPMKRVIASNEGFCRRVTKFFNFSDFSAKELAQILHIKMNSQGEDTLFYGFKLHESCTLQEIASVIERETTEKKRKEMNGGLVDTLLVNARENLDLRLSFDCVDTEEICTIRLEDLEAGLRVFSQ